MNDEGRSKDEPAEQIGRLLTRRQQAYLTGSADGRAFLARLPEQLLHLQKELQLHILGPAGDGATAVALAVTSAEDQKLVLKLDPDVRRAESAAAVMAEWGRHEIAPRVHRQGPGWYLMDRIAGTPLPRPLPLTDLRSAASAISSLHEGWHARVAEGKLFDRMGWLLPLTAERLREARNPLVPPHLAEGVTALLETVREGQKKGVCHGDPVGGNLLDDGSGRILLIDPVPHHDPIEAIAAHWAVRARDGEDAILLLKRHWPNIDRYRAEAWAAVNALTLAAYLLHTRRLLPNAVLALLAPLSAL